MNDNLKLIDAFEAEHFFLSNFYPSPISYEGKEFSTVEHIYQAHKATNELDFERIRRTSTPAQAKRLGRKIKIRDDWELVKLPLMSVFVTLKFDQNPDLLLLLRSTGSAELIEGNWWGDTYWGICNGKGENFLGKILMNVRSGLDFV